MDEINYLPVEFIELDRLGFETKAKEIAAFIILLLLNLLYSIGIRGFGDQGNCWLQYTRFLNNNKEVLSTRS